MALQEADSYRRWHTLDDRRICLLCDKVITGHEIKIRPLGHGTYRPQCPTRGCRASAREWFYHGTTCSFPPEIIYTGTPVISFGT